MAYDEELAERIRNALGPRSDITEKKILGNGGLRRVEILAIKDVHGCSNLV